MLLDVSDDVDGNIAGAFLAFQRDVHGDISYYDAEDSIDQLRGDFLVIQLPVDPFANDELDDSFYQWFIAGVTKDAAGLVGGVEKDVFHLPQPVVLFSLLFLRSDPGVIESDEEEAGGCRYVKRMTVFGCDEEHMAGMIVEGILIDALSAGAMQDIHQLEKIMPVFILWTFVQLLVDDLEGLI